MIFISDTSPLSALAEIGELDLLRRLYGRVVIPEAVRRECLHPHSPPAVAAAIEAADSFFDVMADPILLAEAGTVDPGVRRRRSASHGSIAQRPRSSLMIAMGATFAMRSVCERRERQACSSRRQ